MKDDKKKAAKLMVSSQAKKKMAATQEMIGKAQIKNKVKPGSMGDVSSWTKKFSDIGKKIPVGKERLDIAKKLRYSATQDSIKSVKMYKNSVKKK